MLRVLGRGHKSVPLGPQLNAGVRLLNGRIIMNILLKIYVWIISALLVYTAFSAFVRDIGTEKFSYIIIILMCSFIVSSICLFLSPFLLNIRGNIRYLLLFILFPGTIILLLFSIKEAMLIHFGSSISIQSVIMCMGLIAYIVQYYYLTKGLRAT